MKKILFCLLLLLTGCQAHPESKGTLLHGSALGKHGPIEVEIYLLDDQINQIEVVHHSETPGFDYALIEMIDEVITNHSLDVDLVSGATETSMGVLAAIEDALKNTDMDLLKKPETTPAKKQSQVLIVGGGGAGFAAAIEAIQQGFTNVQIIEKMPFGGGNTRMSGGEFAIPNNALQQKKGIEDSDELFFQDIYAGGGYLGKPELIQQIVDHSHENLDWLMSMGVQYKDTLSWYGGHSVARTLWPIGDGSAYIDTLIQKAINLGVKVDYNTRATHFIQNELGQVVGVKAIYNNEEIDYTAENGVILTTGGFSANIEMRQKYDTQWNKLDESIPTTNSPAIVGDGIVMADEINANLIGMEYIQLYPINNPATGNYYYMDYARIISNAILINENGLRFVDEKETRDNIARAIINQPNSTAFELISQKTIEELGLDQEYTDELLRGIDQGVIVQGTLKECAAHFDIPYQTLCNTVDHYNKMAQMGLDEDYHRTQQLAPLPEGEYLMFSSIVSVHHTMGGVEINEKAEVLDKNGQVIDHLYAAGEVTGGIHGNNRLGTLSIPDTVTFGRIAAQSCAESLN